MKKVLLLAVLTLFLGSGIQNAVAQSLKVSGKVTYADDGTPVIGATVLVEESGTATLTDVNGMYQLTIPSSVQNKVIKVSYAGLASQSKPASANGEVINFEMEQDATDIDAVVVTGYGSARKVGTIVGSVTQVTSKELENRPSASVMDALQGKVPGLQIYTSSGEPGATQSVRLHGLGSIGSSSEPLYILDGIQVSATTIQAMNPKDFESISVLKDASATSVYGSRAANGVIYYTTKRGKGGDAQIRVGVQYGVSTQVSTTFYDNLFSGQELYNFWESSGTYGYNQQGTFAPSDVLTNNYEAGVNTNWLYYYQHQWAPVFQGDVSISGGNEKTNYFISANIYEQDGNAYGSYYNKYSVRSNIESQVKDWMKLGANVQLLYNEVRSNPFFSTNNLNGGLSYLNNPLYTTYNQETGEAYYSQRIPGANLYNPEYLTDAQPQSTKDYGTASSMYIQLEPVENLLITSRGGLEYIYRDFDYKRLASYVESIGNGRNVQQLESYLTATITNTIEYSFDINEDHALTVLVGQEGIAYHSEGLYAAANGIESDELFQLQFGKQSTYDVSSSSSDYSYLSYFGQVNYGFSDKLYVDATVRNDSSSRFGTNNQSATFWALGARWDIKNTFLKENETISALAAKVSYGTQGNSSIGNYTWQGQYSVIGRYDDNAGLGITNSYNPDLTWETQKKLTVAANISLWNRLNINLEYYDRITDDMLMSVPLPSTSGFTSVLKNVGGMRNSGVDFSIDYDIFRQRDYSLNVGFNFNYNKQVITELFDGRDSWTVPNTGVTYAVGQSVSLYYPIWAGIDPATGNQLWYLPGDDFTQTSKEQTTTSFSDALQQNTGYSQYAPIAGGFSVSGHWKNFSLRADFSYVLGKYMINNDKFFSQNPNNFSGYNQDSAITEYWQNPGDEVMFPNWATGATMQFDTHLIENASFLRLKNLVVAYDIPKTVLKGQDVINGIRVSATARNLFTVTEYTGIDPEVDQNLSLGALPNTKQFVFGIELTF